MQKRGIFTGKAFRATMVFSVCLLTTILVARGVTYINALDTRLSIFPGGGPINPDWVGQTVVTHDGVDAAQSIAIGDNATASFSAINVSGPTRISFWWRVSSEYGYDFLTLSLDSVVKDQISGESGWQYKWIDIPAGSHALTWEYVKDAFVSEGSDCGWVDQLKRVVPQNDFDGDGKSDYGCYDGPGQFGYPPGSWYVQQSSLSYANIEFGYDGAEAITGDFDGDGNVDIGCYDAGGHYGNASGSWWFQLDPSTTTTANFGYDGTVPVTGDFDGDEICDYGCYDAAGNYGQPPGSWYLMLSKNGFTTKCFGYYGTVPIVGDFDGDGICDYGCYDAAGNYGQPPGSWYLMLSKLGFVRKYFGYYGTVPIVGDFDGDGICDYGCYDAAGNYGQPPGSWYLMMSKDGFTTKTFGYAGTMPVVGDFDGDGQSDYGCYDSVGYYGQPAGSWYLMMSKDGFTTDTFGHAGAVPLAAYSGPSPPLPDVIGGVGSEFVWVRLPPGGPWFISMKSHSDVIKRNNLLWLHKCWWGNTLLIQTLPGYTDAQYDSVTRGMYVFPSGTWVGMTVEPGFLLNHHAFINIRKSIYSPVWYRLFGSAASWTSGGNVYHPPHL